jgi:hypothetical protein
MRKRLAWTLHSPAEQGWLDLESTAWVEITSEDIAFPIESALLQRGNGGWRVAEPAAQTIRLILDQPQSIKQLALLFVEKETQRTQEFTLRSSEVRPPRGPHAFAIGSLHDYPCHTCFPQERTARYRWAPSL